MRVIADGVTPSLLQRLAELVGGSIGRHLVPQIKRLDALEQRLAALEAQPLPKYCGVFEQGKSYAACSLVTRQGGLWLATEATTLVPGQGGPWRLIVKSGGAER